MSNVVQDVINEVESIVGEVKNELGLAAHALALSLSYDANKALDALKAAGKAAEGEIITITKQEMTDFWATTKDAVVAQWSSLNGSFESKVSQMLASLKTINWQKVGTNLAAVSESTLLTAARVGIQMFVSGLIA